MDWSIRSLSLLLTLLLVGLSAGLFYAWAVSVIPGTKRISDNSYLETMQMINRAILNPYFFIIFLGPVILLFINTYHEYRIGRAEAFWLLLSASLAYLIGTFGITVVGNVPLNEWLDEFQLEELTTVRLSNIRKGYEQKWNRYHFWRTFFAVLAFCLSLLVVFIGEKV